jgi:glyoxylase-like metal-dependent hydrolase (beta-lactamase superfamily II)
VITGGETLPGGFTVAYTPGHASHHVSYLHDGTAFVGDVAGVRITDSTITIPPTPPPDIDVEAWHRSIDLVAAWEPERLAMTHFGDSEDVTGQLAEVSDRLDAWAELARTVSREEFVSGIRAEIEQQAGAGLAASYEQAAPAEQLFAGLERYWRKRAER